MTRAIKIITINKTTNNKNIHNNMTLYKNIQ